MKKLINKAKQYWHKIRLWFWMRSIKKDLDRIDRKLNSKPSPH
jgi:hypothetical protein